MAINKLIITTNVKKSQIESTDTDYIIKGIPITVNGAVMNGIHYPREENKKGMDTLKGKPFTINHPMDDAGNFISALEGKGLKDYFSGGIITNVYENVENDTWYADAEIKKSILLAQNGGKELADKLDDKSDLGVSTGLYFEDNQINGVNESGKKYTKTAKNQQYNHLASVSSPAGGKSTTAVFNSENTFVCNFSDIKANELSFDEIRELLQKKIKAPDNSKYWNYVYEVYGDYFIYSDADKSYKQSYSILNGEAILGDDKKEVQRSWKEVIVNRLNDFITFLHKDKQSGYNKGDNVLTLEENHDMSVTLEQLQEALAANQAATAETIASAVNAAVKPLQDKIDVLEQAANASKGNELKALKERATKAGMNALLVNKLTIEDAPAVVELEAKQGQPAFNAQVGGKQEQSKLDHEIDLNAFITGESK